MKKLLILSLVALCCMTTMSCGDDDDPVNNNDNPSNTTPGDNNGNNSGENNSGENNGGNTSENKPNLTATALHIKNNKVSKEFWQVQYQVASNLNLTKGKEYEIAIKAMASDNATLRFRIGDWGDNVVDLSIDVTKEMQEYKQTFTAAGGGHVLFQTGDFVGDIYVESVKITHKGKVRELTAEEKRDTLIWAMDHWIEGVMTATDGFVKAWDVVNEALSGNDGDRDGIYDLQNYKNNNISDPTNVSSGTFYWQVYMGDLEYVRTAVKSARKHFKGDPSELKLFINDYNLESTWDDNQKLKSLIKWIDKWEADGETYIDGIGTQMHISCYADAGLQKDAEDHIVKMFQLMAETGRLVRVSELDMGYVRGSNKWSGNIKTNQVTAAEHQQMADFYEFILRKYFEIVPPAQQYGFCQWCTTDAPSGGGWRGGEPVGIWTEGYKARKAAYKGFAQGLAEQKLEGDVTELLPLKMYVDRSKHPNFKFSGAIEAWDFNSNAKLRDTIAANFDEIVAGNSMKYSSCVNGSGDLNFNTVTQFCDAAKAKGLTIYGHTLAWHSQQQPGYLLGLMNNVEVDVPDAEKEEVTDCDMTYAGMKSYNMWKSDNNASDNIDYTIDFVKP